MKTTRTILLAAFLILAALFFAGAAQPQALIVDTAGQTVGDGQQTVAPIDVAQENGDTQAAASAGHGTGSAAQARAENGDDSATATVGCIDAAASSGDLGASASLGNCDGGSTVGGGGGGGAGVEDGATGGGLDLGCLTVALDGTPSAGLQLGACEGSAGGGGNDDGDDGSGNGDNGDNGAGGVLDEQAGGSLGESGSGGDQGDGNDEPCGTFDQASALASPGSLPMWLFALVALGGFGLGTFLTRRRARRSEPLS